MERRKRTLNINRMSDKEYILSQPRGGGIRLTRSQRPVHQEGGEDFISMHFNVQRNRRRWYSNYLTRDSFAAALRQRRSLGSAKEQAQANRMS